MPEYQPPYTGPYLGAYSAPFGGMLGAASKYLLDARFDSYLGVLDQSLVDLDVLGPAQGVQVGSVTLQLASQLSTDDIAGGELRYTQVANGSGLIRSTNESGFVHGQFIKTKWYSKNIVPAQHAVGFQTSIGATSARSSLRFSELNGLLEYRDGSSFIVVAPNIPLITDEVIEFCIIQANTQEAFYYYKSESIPWTLVGHTALFTNQTAIYAVLSYESRTDQRTIQTDYGSDATAILDARGPDIFVGPYEQAGPSAGEWTDNGDGTWSITAATGNAVIRSVPDPASGADVFYENTFEVLSISGGVVRMFTGTSLGVIDRTTPGIHTQILNAGPVGTLGGWIQAQVGVTCTVRVDTATSRKVEVPAAAIDALKGDIVSASFGPAETASNTLTVLNGEELHDDYPTNGVGKIRKGILSCFDIGLGDNLGVILSGGMASSDPAAPTDWGRGLWEKNDNDVVPGLTYEQIILFDLADYVFMSGFRSTVGTNPSGVNAGFWGLGNAGACVMNGVNESGSILPGNAAGEQVKYEVTMLPYNASGEPVPSGGTKGALFSKNGVLVYSSDTDTSPGTVVHKATYNGRNPPQHSMSMRTKINTSKLATPWRGLFNSPVESGDLALVPITEANWIQEDVSYDEIPFGGAWTITNNILTANPAGGTANDKAGNRYAIANGNSYRVVVNVSTYRAGAGTLVIGTLAGININGPGEFEYTSANPLDITEGFSTHIGIGRGTLDADIDRMEIYETLSRVADYVPENGAALVERDVGRGEVADGQLGCRFFGASTLLAVYDNPGGGYWEHEVFYDNTGGFGRVSAVIRYQDGLNYWAVHVYPNPTITSNIDIQISEVIAGTGNLRATLETTLTWPATFRIITTDDGETITAIIPADGSSISYSSTAGADATAAGTFMYDGPDPGGYVALNWMCARMGTTKEYTP